MSWRRTSAARMQLAAAQWKASTLVMPEGILCVGGVESRIGQTATTNHASIAAEIQMTRCVDGGCNFLSVGIEDEDVEALRDVLDRVLA